MAKINYDGNFSVGVFLIFLAFFFFSSKLFTSKDLLVQKSGEIEKINIHYQQVKSSRFSGGTKCTLLISLKNDKRIYSILKNIGGQRVCYEFETIRVNLESYKSAKIWIRRSEVKSVRPNVFQIANGADDILYDFEDAKSLSKHGFIGAFSLGLLFIFLSYSKPK